MVYIPRKVKKGAHFAEYKKGIRTKSAELKRALEVAKASGKHLEHIDFIPAKFTLQIHGWFDPKVWKNLKETQSFLKQVMKAGKDPVKEFEKKGGKFHYDLRIKKNTAPTWFGLTPFRAPWTGTAENKVLGTVKGYQTISPGGKKLQKFLSEEAEKRLASEGVAERRDRIEWMKIKAQWFAIDSPGNPQKNQPAIMLAIEFHKPACLHRRDLDFFDITFFGDYLKGRYYNRLVERKISADNLMEWQKKDIKSGKVKTFYNLSFYFWKSKDQWGDKGTIHSMKDVFAAALGKKTLEKIPAPPSKSSKDKTVKVPDTTAEFH